MTLCERRDGYLERIAIACGMLAILFGASTAWTHYTGTSAAVTVLECHRAGRHHECTGQWEDGTTTRQVYIVADPPLADDPLPRAGAVVPMRIHGPKAYSQSARSAWLAQGIGATLVVLGGYARRRRQRA
ncbi:hypothetical protein MAUB1S_03704 [Mycolicibacterium aubagnense]